MSADPKPRASIKSTALDSASWKEKLRKECFDRLSSQRSRLLWRARERGGRDTVQQALRDIIDSSSARLQHDDSDMATCTPAGDVRDAGDALPNAASMRTPASGVKRSLHAVAADEPESLDAADYKRLMQTLEAALYKDLLREEAEYLDSLQQQDVDSAVEAYYSQPVGSLGDGAQDVLCPLCLDAFLVLHHGMILCPRQHLRLDAAEAGMDLAELRQRLAECLQAHVRAGCLAQPTFEQRGRLGKEILVMSCATCDAMDVIL